MIIGTLEELSLHQEDVDEINNVQNWCKNLRILLLQNNLISRIENLHKLKQLEYLNLALNNIECIENLEALESLEKLDLTLNFIGKLTSVETLKNNYNLKELILTGNPCVDYVNYREYVITVLPQLQSLDCSVVTQTDRLLAKQNFQSKRNAIVQAEAVYVMHRDEQKIRIEMERVKDSTDTVGLTNDEINDRYKNLDIIKIKNNNLLLLSV